MRCRAPAGTDLPGSITSTTLSSLCSVLLFIVCPLGEIGPLLSHLKTKLRKAARFEVSDAGAGGA